MIDLETFYLNERTTIQCSARDFTQITSLELRINEGRDQQQTGCGKSSPEWTGTDLIFSESLISGSDCETAVQSTPFIITLQPTITEQLRGASLFCYAYDTATATEYQTRPVTISNIKGEPLA